MSYDMAPSAGRVHSSTALAAVYPMESNVGIPGVCFCNQPATIRLRFTNHYSSWKFQPA
jgi:hypothetical protein